MKSSTARRWVILTSDLLTLNFHHSSYKGIYSCTKSSFLVILSILFLFPEFVLPAWFNLTDVSTIRSNAAMATDYKVANDFYRSIVTSSEQASGTVYLRLKSGSGKTQIAGTPDVLWKVLDGTVAKVTFDYQGGQWNGLSMDFGDKPISITLTHFAPINDKKNFIIRIIHFKKNGEPNEYLDYNLTPQPIPELLYFPELRQHLKIVASLETLLLSHRMFAGLPDSNNGTPVMGTEVVSLDNVSQPKGTLYAKIKPGAAIPFSGNLGADACGNSITLREATDMVFDSLLYEIASGRTEGTLGPVSFHPRAGCLKAGETVFRLKPDSEIKFTSMRFGSAPDGDASSVVSGSNGSFIGVMEKGTTISLAHNDTQKSAFILGDNGLVKLENLELEGRGLGRLALRFSSGSCAAPIESGKLYFSPNNFITLQNNQFLQLELDRSSWSSASIPQVQGRLKQFIVNVDGGELKLNDQTKLLISDGHLEADQLNFNSTVANSVAGELSFINFNLKEQTAFGVPNYFKLSAAKGGTVKLSAGMPPITFRNDKEGPFGRLQLFLPIASGTAKITTNSELKIKAGHIDADVTRNPNEPLAGQIAGGFDINGGSFELKKIGQLTLTHGVMTFDSLRFDEAKGLYGPLTTLGLELTQAEFDWLPSLHITSQAGATLTRAKNSTPFVISSTGDFVGSVAINIPVASGLMQLGQSGRVDLKGGRANLMLTSSVDGSLDTVLGVNVEVTSGSLQLDSTTALSIADGSRLEASQLAITTNGVYGPFSNVTLKIKPASTFNLPNRKVLTASGNASFTALNTNAPFTLIEGQQGPIGSFSLEAPFTRLDYQATPAIYLTQGKVQSLISRNSGEPLRWISSITGDQVGTYSNLSELPVDEFQVLTHYPDGVIRSIQADSRVMIVNNIPCEQNSPITFYATGTVARALLSKDINLQGLPLKGHTMIDLAKDTLNIVSATVAQAVTVGGVPLSAGCTASFPSGPAAPPLSSCQEVTSLEVRITTSNDFWAGTHPSSDDVWLDIGPKAYKITGGFDRGQTRKEPINFRKVEDDITDPGQEPIPLFEDEITQIRLEKKGLKLPSIGGVTNAPDSWYDVAGQLLGVPYPNLGAIPHNLLAPLKIHLQESQYAFERANGALREVENKLAQVQQFLDETDALEKKVAQLRDIIKKGKNDLIDLVHRIEVTPLNLTHDVCQQVRQSKWKWLGVLTGWGFVVELVTICHVEHYANPLIRQLLNQKDALLKQLTDWGVDLAAAEAQLTIYLSRKAASLELKAFLETSKNARKIAYDFAEKAFQVATALVNEAQKLIDLIPVPDIGLPKLGEWKPENITLIVNGKEYSPGPLTINERLKMGHTSWIRYLRPMTPEQQFVNGLRVNINHVGYGFESFSSIATTVFKIANISGWESGPSPSVPISSATIIGKLKHEPSEGGDGYVSLDLELEEVRAGDSVFILDGQHGIRGKRYLRVEYLHGDDDRYKSWHSSDRFEVTGSIRRDMDRHTFFEIVPERKEGIRKL